MPVVENKLDKLFVTLSNNASLYQQLIDAVEAEIVEARNQLNSCAVQALYHPDMVAQACGQGGVVQAWSDILSRVQRFQHK